MDAGAETQSSDCVLRNKSVSASRCIPPDSPRRISSYKSSLGVLHLDLNEFLRDSVSLPPESRVQSASHIVSDECPIMGFGSFRNIDL